MIRGLNKKEWLPVAVLIVGEAGQSKECKAIPQMLFRGEDFFAVDTTRRPGFGTVIESVIVGNYIQLPTPVFTWVFGEWIPPEERGEFEVASKLLGTPFESPAIRAAARRRDLANAAERMLWKTCNPSESITFRVRFLETCVWQAVVWGWSVR